MLDYHLETLGCRPVKDKTQKQKSIYSDEYGILLRLLRETREKAGITQVQLAARLGQSQSALRS